MSDSGGDCKMHVNASYKLKGAVRTREGTPLYPFSVAAVTNCLKQQLKTIPIYYLTILRLEAGNRSHRAKIKVSTGENLLPCHSGHWQNQVPCSCRIDLLSEGSQYLNSKAA